MSDALTDAINDLIAAAQFHGKCWAVPVSKISVEEAEQNLRYVIDDELDELLESFRRSNREYREAHRARELRDVEAICAILSAQLQFKENKWTPSRWPNKPNRP